MKKFSRALAGITLCMLVFGGCSVGNDTTDTRQTEENADVEIQAELLQTDSDMFTERDYETDFDAENSVFIQLDGDSVTAGSDSVLISGSTVTITEENVYVLSGNLDDGMIIVDAPETAKIQLVFDGVSINSGTSAPLYILNADKVFLTLAEGSENILSNGGDFTAIDESNIDGAVFSKQDLTINGTGYLSVYSPAGHGIVCKDDLVITGGTCEITSASHGLDANDSIRLTGETVLKIDAGKDGLHVENSDDSSLGYVYISGGSMDVEAAGDGISAGAYMLIKDGKFNILAGGGSENGTKDSSDSWGGFMGEGRCGEPSENYEEETDESATSMKGIKSTGPMLVSGGTYIINSADDAVHSNTSITITGGDFEIATGDDAFHADEALTMTDGIINISESYEGMEALDLSISGGDIVIVSSDDGLNAAGGTDSSGTTGGRDGRFDGPGGMSSGSNGSIRISGGTIYINASGDGIDANGSVYISGGTITITGPIQGDTSILDFDTSAVITGGTFIGTGASAMAQTFTSSEQGVIAVSAGNQSAGTNITITGEDGEILLDYAPELPFSAIIFSSPEVVTGENYNITAGETSGESQAK